MKPLFIHSVGLINSQGASLEEVYRSIFIKSSAQGETASLLSGRKTVAMKVHRDLPELGNVPEKFNSRNNRLLWFALNQIKPTIDDAIMKFGRHRVAVILGTTTSGILEAETAFKNKNQATHNYHKQEISSPSEFLAYALGLNGISYTVSTACTSSAKVFIESKRLIDGGFCDAAVVGGVDALSSLTLDGFDSLDSVSSQLTNPFSKNRAGINIGEGAALFLVSPEPSPYRLSGYGESSDAYHQSSPDPEGRGGEMAIKQALKIAKLEPSQIHYINLHGTGTLKNDFMESHLVHRIFGPETFVSSTKMFIGHTLGSAGAQELALCYLALSPLNSENRLPAHVWDGEQDPDLAALNFVTKEASIKIRHCMSNSFAFGGNNVSLILSRE